MDFIYSFCNDYSSYSPSLSIDIRVYFILLLPTFLSLQTLVKQNINTAIVPNIISIPNPIPITKYLIAIYFSETNIISLCRPNNTDIAAVHLY